MIALFVSECEKAAWKRSRRILSRYAVQIGRRTWLARMSMEGLENVRNELLSCVSRHMSVACHRIRGRYGTQLIWIVGTRRHFSVDGEFAFSHTQRPIIMTLKEKTPLQRLLNYMVALAALFHDTGKMILSFQNKLRDAALNQSDPIRHERISVIFFLALLEEVLPQAMMPEDPDQKKRRKTGLRLSRKKSHGRISGPDPDLKKEKHIGKICYLSDDASWLEPLSITTGLYSALDRIWENGLSHYQKYIPAVSEDSKNVPLTPNWHMEGSDSGMPVLLTSMIYLLLSHHKMPQGDEHYCPLESNYINTPERITAGLIFAKDLEPVWKTDLKWVARIRNTVCRIVRLLKDSIVDYESCQNAWFSAVQFLGRPALVYADQAVSRESVEKTELAVRSGRQGAIRENICYANATKQRTMAQPLSEHLIETTRRAGSVLHRLLELQQKAHCPTISRAPEPLTASIPPHKEGFLWQERADRLIQRTQNIQKDGFFGMVMSETGSGKTRANARILSALNRHADLRFTVALGLRTLTLQTGDEYIRELGFTKDNAGIMVGSALSRLFFEAEKDEQKDFTGTESADIDGDFYEGLIGGFDLDPDSPWPHELALPKRPKMEAMMKLPVVVCTVDHLIPVVQRGKSSASLIMARLAGSDLIIDEIDSYYWKDLVALLKLAYLTGFNGNRLLVSSATMPPATARALYAAYGEGYKRFCCLNQKAFMVHTGWFTHLSGESQVKKTNTLRAFQKYHDGFIKNYVQKIAAQPVRRRVEILDVDHEIENRDETAVFHKVLSACMKLHERYHETDPETNIRCSVGCVRWNYVRNARAFAKFGLNDSSQSLNGAYPLFLAYHSKHLPLIRHEMELCLSRILRRKPGSTPLTAHPLIRDHLQKARAARKSDLVIIISTSPISEVGRDFDFDWGILEPCSYWSLIQMAGRIWRHRPELTAHLPNMMLLSTTMQGLNDSRKISGFFPPWPEEPDIRLDRDGLFKTKKYFDMALLSHKVDAIPTLTEPEGTRDKPEENVKLFAEMRDLEHGKLKEIFENPSRKFSVRNFLLPSYCGVYFSTRHADENPFRDRKRQSLIWYEAEPRPAWRKLEKNRVLKFDSQIDEDIMGFPGRSLLDPARLDRERLYEDWLEKLRHEGLDDPKIALGFETNLEENGSYQYNDLLGWIRKPSKTGYGEL